MSESTDEGAASQAPGLDRSVVLGVVIGFVVILAVAGVAVRVLAPPQPIPRDVESDPLLAAGYRVFEDRCLSCHGRSGKGDGPIARSLAGPRVGDLTDAEWKHGDKPEQVQAVIENGVPNTAMPPWGRTLSPDDLRGVAAYVYHLAGRSVPEELRKP